MIVAGFINRESTKRSLAYVTEKSVSSQRIFYQVQSAYFLVGERFGSLIFSRFLVVLPNILWNMNTTMTCFF